MSCIIRAVKGSWLPVPNQTSNDASIPPNADTYKLAQIAIEAAARLQQSQMNRAIRAGGRASVPQSANRPVPFPSTNNFVLNLPIK